MNQNIPKPIRQFAAAGLLFAVLAAIWFAVAVPFAGRLSAMQSEISDKRALLGRLNDGRGLETEAKSLAERAANVKLDDKLLAGDSEALKGATLQTALGKIVSAHGVRLRSARSLNPREENGVRLVAVEASFEAPLTEVQKILLDLDEHEPVLIVSGLRIALAPAAMLDPETAGNLLEVSVEVAGPAQLISPAPGKG